MTEERMICECVGKIDGVHVGLPRYKPIEPTPPPGFKPKCHDKYELKTISETDEFITLRKIWRCVSCDIREKCIYKRE